MENDDFSKIVRAFDEKDAPSSRFFMPDNFYDEKANIINDFENEKEEHFVGDPALRSSSSASVSNFTTIKDNSVDSSNSDNITDNFSGSNDIDGTDSVFKKLISGNGENPSSFDPQITNIDTADLFNPKFVEYKGSEDNFSLNNNNIVSSSDTFSSNSSTLNNDVNINQSISDIGKLQPDDKEVSNTISNSWNDRNVNDDTNIDLKKSDSVSGNEVKENSINKILSNTLGVNFANDNQDDKHPLYDDLRTTNLDTSNKISGPSLDANFTVTGDNDYVDKTLSSHKEFSNLDLGKGAIYQNNQEYDDLGVSGLSNQWESLPKSTYKAASVTVPVIGDDSNLGVFSNGPKVLNNVVDVDSLSSDKNISERQNDDLIMDSKNDVQSWINRILKVDNSPVKINSDGSIKNDNFSSNNNNDYMSNESVNNDSAKTTNLDIDKYTKREVDYDFSVKDLPVHKSDLLVSLEQKQEKDGKISILVRYGEDFCSKDYITNPAIGRSEEIKQLILILLTPEKSGILVGKPGIGKTSIVEGLAYQLQRDNVPDALRGYTIVNVKTASLLGTLPSGETRLQTLIDELKNLEKVILFIDEIHMLIGATNDSALDFANMFKEGLGRGKIKVIGATTTEEYERYILRDKAFVRRFQKVEVLEPSREHTIRIMMGTLPKIEKTTNAKLKYDNIVKGRIMGFIVDITSEYKRIYGIGSRYPDICLTLLSQAFSQAVFDDRKEVNIFDIRNAIENSKNIYPDVIRKELQKFDKMFENVIRQEQGLPPVEESSSRF